MLLRKSPSGLVSRCCCLMFSKDTSSSSGLSPSTTIKLVNQKWMNQVLKKELASETRDGNNNNKSKISIPPVQQQLHRPEQPHVLHIGKGNNMARGGSDARMLRVGSAIQHVLGDILSSDFSPFFKNKVHYRISISNVKMSKDLRTATVMWETWPSPKPERMALMNKILNDSAGHLRKLLAPHLQHIRHVPTIQFSYEEKSYAAEHLDKVLESARKTRELEERYRNMQEQQQQQSTTTTDNSNRPV